MKWFYIILSAAAVAGTAVVLGRLTHVFDRRTIQIIVAASMMIIFVALIKFLNKLHD